MQARCPQGTQSLAQGGHHIQTKSTDGGRIVAVGLQPQANPARNFCASGIRKPHELGRIGDRHDTGNDRNAHAQALHIVHKAGVGIGVVEVLGDGRIGPGTHFGGEGLQVGFGAARLGMHLRVGGHFNVEIVPKFLADKGHQIAGVMKLPAHAVAAGQIAAQRH